MKITFHGGAKTVTGANYLLEHNGIKMLIDCGLNQGGKYAEDLNYQPFNYSPSEINYVFVTHSHIDHIGRLPKLYKDGFRGVVYATKATSDLMEVALPDNMRQIQIEAKGADHAALFEQEDIGGLMSLVQNVEYDKSFPVGDVDVVFHDAGHILGSSIIEIKWKVAESVGGQEFRKIYFSGDLGNPPTPLLRETEKIKDADYVVVESAYGNRVHEGRDERRQKLTSVIKDTVDRGGVLMVPSFAVERTQEFLYELNNLLNENKIPKLPVFVDSPLAIKMTEVYRKNSGYFNLDTKYLIDSGDDIFNFPGLKMTSSTEESKKINEVPAPKVIIAGSGMSQGGRILHHEARYLPDPNSTILFVGYQVDGSLGRKIQKGDLEVRIMGQTVPVRCHIENLASYSAHADQPNLLEWVGGSVSFNGGEGRLKKVFVVQGEDESSRTLANLIHERYGVDAVAPVTGQEFSLD
ncbi:MAG TPA: MBL fold metallo-hydrolase [Candidatus Paceibacterota bacterium]